MIETKTIATLYGKEGFESIIGTEAADLVNDACTVEGRSFALGNLSPMTSGDLQLFRKQLLGKRSKAATVQALARTSSLMDTRCINLIQ